MNDRLKFRARIYSVINRNEEDEKEISFYIYNVAVYSDGGIGFSRDQLVDALNKLDLTDKQKEEIEEDISDNSYCEDYEWYSIEFGQVEQYTGLKDKNGKLIYEGDIIKTECFDEVTVYKVVWDVTMACFLLDNKDEAYSFDEIPADMVEVCGNIHENKELLDD